MYKNDNEVYDFIEKHPLISLVEIARASGSFMYSKLLYEKTGNNVYNIPIEEIINNSREKKLDKSFRKNPITVVYHDDGTEHPYCNYEEAFRELYYSIEGQRIEDDTSPDLDFLTQWYIIKGNKIAVLLIDKR